MFKKILFSLTPIALVISIYLIFFVAPIPVDPMDAGGNPINFKIFYFHVPIAITAYLAFTIVFISGIKYLRTKQEKWDTRAVSAAEVGVIFAFLTLITGSLWARSAWGEYWVTWDVRLNTSLVLFLIYISYLMVRKSIDEPEKRARLSSVFGIIGFISVPLSFLSIRLWNRATVHPVVIGSGGGGISGDVVIGTVLMNIVAFILLLILLVTLRIDNEILSEKIDFIKRTNNL
ncbi:cytochrome c biogenesis protein [Candidatus Methanoperedens nitratireducens]|uniref:Cytochrome c assembly protein n=1 Tax=Candidatus Methanoperedens nitratireducens TaxID=1392998 RepID=A0A284VQV1_9EURY|nr:cytochrome c biogenesis protein CcsA [Candidatus Methanoperedens nitroreducens]SNQ61664.1 Cytochrome c assembly protein [Candidatus Methanoperedens nitroreducens]